MPRLPDWQTRLESFFFSNQNRPFEYGAWDCCLMAAAAIEVMNGKHPHPEYIGQYHDRLSCLQLIKQETGTFDAGAMWAKVMLENGFPEIAPMMAQRGDALMVRDPTAENVIGILGMDGKIVICRRDGIARADPTRTIILKAWRI